MAELSVKERLQPSLLDRLTDDEPHVQRESRRDRVLELSSLRAAVLRDLGWLLNCECLAADDQLERFPHVARSVLNFGLPALTGLTASGVDVGEITRRVREAILCFEPRLVPETVVVRPITDEGSETHNALSFVIEGTLWAQPLPLALFMKTEIDLESGSVSLVETSMNRREE